MGNGNEVESAAEQLYYHWLKVKHPQHKFSWEEATEQLKGVFRVCALVLVTNIAQHEAELYSAYLDTE